ncbi:hypothetical protein [Halomonas sp. LBP4]|uniref:hypothetical protein n=1 Tax=Halomonas sp. LBP4 TaxID=2044917 RepID=UPI000D7590C0|nr:hypothetical protein [Halomonas sp. LBP4]PXX96421.1 hypothetical protein CR157_14470 [Halomonas sp. LBP4]
MSADQADGLRQWASSAPPNEAGCPRHVAEMLCELAVAGPSAPIARPPSPAVTRASSPVTLMVVGLPDGSPRQARRVGALIDYWAAQGRRWVGDPAAWQVVPVGVTSPHLALLAAQQPRWALWVEGDAEAFRRAWRVLIRLAERPGPRRLLAVHPPGISRHGLLDNLQQAAAAYLGIELVVLA